MSSCTEWTQESSATDDSIPEWECFFFGIFRMNIAEGY